MTKDSKPTAIEIQPIEFEVNEQTGIITLKQKVSRLSLRADTVQLPIVQLKMLFATMLQREVQILTGGKLQAEVRAVDAAGPKPH